LLKLIIKNISWLFSEKLLSMLVALVTMNYLLAIIAMLGPIVVLGLNSIVVRELNNQPQSNDKIISTVICFRLIGALIGAFLYFCFAYFSDGISDVDEVALYILGFASIFKGLNGLEFWFQAKVCVRYNWVVHAYCLMSNLPPFS
jgi:O-antigen/teichoic acid export membrane protein